MLGVIDEVYPAIVEDKCEEEQETEDQEEPPKRSEPDTETDVLLMLNADTKQIII